MSVAVFLVCIIVVVSALSLVFARRFGVLVLALAAGFVLAQLWSPQLAIWLSSVGLDLTWIPNGALATVLLIVAPLAFLLVGGPKYSNKIECIVSALLIGVLTVAFLVKPLGKFVVLDGPALSVYVWISSIWQYVVTLGIILGILDLLFMYSQKTPKLSKKH